MSTRFIAEGVWNEITAAASRTKQRSWVAVAFFGKGGPGLLPLAPGSYLVVNASESSVKSGLTCPAALKRLVNQGIKVFSVDNLHAKTFIFGKTAFIGSANVSPRSANHWVEAVVRTTDSQAVAQAREFVESICLNELGPAELDRLQTLYRPPKLPVKERMRRNGSQSICLALPRLHVAQLEYSEPPVESTETYNAGWAYAKSQMEHPRQHVLTDIHWPGTTSFKDGDMLLQVTSEPHNLVLVSSPAKVIHTRKWSNGRATWTFVYLEAPPRRRIRKEVMAKKLGYGGQKLLERDGLIRNQQDVRRLLECWKD
jgi:hypothetical protein